MTSVCVGSVASRPKTGVPDRIYLDTLFMSSVLPAPLNWLQPFLPYLPPMFVDVNGFCTGEPPSPPNLTEATMAAVLAGGEFGAGVVAAELIFQVIQSQLWYVLCECSSGAAPAPPTGQAEPTGLVKINPPNIVTPTPVGTCETATSPSLTPTIFSAARLFGVRITAGGGPPRALPSGATLIRYTLHSVSTGATHKTMDFFHYPYTTATQEATPTIQSVLTGTTVTLDVPVTPGTYGFQLSAQTHDGTATTDVAFADMAVYCGGQPGQVREPCCPPDPQLTGMVTRILEYVTLIQRQSVPFGYVSSTAHTALSGAGAISISGLLGVKVAVTTLPTSYGVAGTSPPEHFDLGFVTFGTADGFPSAFRLTRNPQVMMPARCSVYTDVDYDLAPGVVVTITELVREP